MRLVEAATSDLLSFTVISHSHMLMLSRWPETGNGSFAAYCLNLKIRSTVSLKASFSMRGTNYSRRFEVSKRHGLVLTSIRKVLNSASNMKSYPKISKHWTRFIGFNFFLKASIETIMYCFIFARRFVSKKLFDVS